MTLIGNAMKWALLLPIFIIGAAVGMFCAFASGFGLASLFTTNESVLLFSGLVSLAMGLGAFVGVRIALDDRRSL